MSAPRVEIGELRLRVPGITRSQARELARRVAAGLASAQFDGEGNIAALTVRVPADATSSAENLTRQIVAAIRSRSKS